MISPSRLRRVLSLLVTLTIGYALVCAAAYVFQERLVYFPSGRPTTTPDVHGLEWEDLTLETRDGVALDAWYVHAPAEPRGAVVLSHGNGGHIGHWMDTARAFTELGFDVLLYDYRGYGGSAGTPTEEGTYLDAEAAWAVVADRFPPERIVSYGQSLGGAVAVELARRHPVGAVVVESTFTSIVDVGAEAYPWLPVRFLARIRYDTLTKLPELAVPILVLHSPDDRMVSFDHARRLAESAPGRTELHATRGGHNDGGFELEPAAMEALGHFLARAIEP